MPFAVIAVTLLILAGSYGVVAASVERAQDNVKSIQDEMNSVSDATDSVKEIVERGMGEIILNMSRETSTGSLEERFDTFDVRLKKWIEFQFPMRTSGTVVSVLSYDIELSVGSMKVASDDMFSSNGVSPSCFRADGDIEVKVITSSGNLVKRMDVSADGMSALPMLLRNASLFELSVTGPWSLVTELMTYQLTSLAQYRVISGYGATSEHGERGTNAIITESDVRLAYHIALSVAETTYLRTVSDDNFDLTGRDNVDVAELIAFKNGYAEMDLGAVLAQTLAGIADDLIIRWMDYFMLTKILDIIDTVTDSVRRALDWLRKAVTGNESETAQNSLRTVMSDRGIPESEYRYLLNGSGGVLNIPSAEFEMADVGDMSIMIPEFCVEFGYPNVDVLNWNGWSGFMNRYRSEHNGIRDMLMLTINNMAFGLAKTYGLGTIRIPCSPYDTESFADTMTNAIRMVLSSQRSAVECLMEETIRSGGNIDPFHVSMYKQMESGADSLFGISSMRNNIRSDLMKNVTDHVKKEYGMPLDTSVLDFITDRLMLSDDVVNVIEGYQNLVNDRMRMFDDILNNVEKNGNSIFNDVTAALMRYGMERIGLDHIGLYPYLEWKTVMLVREMLEQASLNVISVYELPDADSFTLDDGKGTIVREYVSLDCDVDLDIRIISPTDGEENIHYTDYLENREASYSSMFRIYVTADLRYRAESASAFMKMLGTCDAAVSGTSYSEFDIAIAVMSGWALTGVDYEPDKTVIDDLRSIMMILIEPLLGPLYELMRMAKSLLNMMTGAVMRVVEFVGDLLMRLYDAVMGPLGKLADVVGDLMDRLFTNIITNFVLELKKQTFELNIYGMKLEVITNIAEQLKNGSSVVKLKLTLPVFGVLFGATLEIKKNKDSGFAFAGGVSATAETWNLDIAVDPLLKVRKHLVEINGTFRGTDLHAVMPQIVQYDELEYRLSDIPAVGNILSNIPLPIPGVKGSLDAGFELKYNLPYVYGVVINEFELNPPGPDSGNEWVELYNSSVSAVNLDGYSIITFSSAKVYEIKDIVLGPGERVVITFPGQFLNNTRESVTLHDADGNVVDMTPIKTDTNDNDSTWQRETDASVKWVFKKHTKNADNGGKYTGGNPIKAAIAQCTIDAANKAFGEMGLKIVGPDGVALFLKRVIELTVENAVNMIAGCVVSASVFIEIVLSDVSGSLHSGIRFSLIFDKEIVKDGLTWAIGQITAMMDNIDNPTGMTPKQIVNDDIYFRTMVFTQITTPKVLGNMSNIEGVTAGVSVSCNLTALNSLFGRGGGNTWRVDAGLVFEEFPAQLVPPMFKTDPYKKTDFWLFHITFEKAK